MAVNSWRVVTGFGDGDLWYMLLAAPRPQASSMIAGAPPPSVVVNALNAVNGIVAAPVAAPTSVGTVVAVPGNPSSSVAASSAAPPSVPHNANSSQYATLVNGGYCCCGERAPKLLAADIGVLANSCELFFHLRCWRNMSLHEQLDAYQDAVASQQCQHRPPVEPALPDIVDPSQSDSEAADASDDDTNKGKGKGKAKGRKGRDKNPGRKRRRDSEPEETGNEKPVKKTRNARG